MPVYKIEGTKGDHKIAEQAHSLTKAQWVEAVYRAEGYDTEIVEISSKEIEEKQ